MAKEERIVSMKKILDQLEKEREEAGKRQRAAATETEKMQAELSAVKDKANTAWSLIGKTGQFLKGLAKFSPKSTAATQVSDAMECCKEFVDAKAMEEELERKLEEAQQKEEEAKEYYQRTQEKVENVRKVIANYQQAIDSLNRATEAADETISRYANQP